MNSQPIFAEVQLRRRSPGYLRLQLPEILCREDIAGYLVQGMKQLQGVRRVVVYAEPRKLSIFYMDTVCDEYQVVRKFARLVELLVQRHFVTPEGKPVQPSLGVRIKDRIHRPFAELKQRVSGWRGQAKTARTLLNAQWQVNPALRLLGDNPERAIFGFINDIVSIYLIKVHWELIVGKWLKSPLRYRYEWMTIFYFIFLLVRSRKK
jgi:hypothetical protein